MREDPVVQPPILKEPGGVSCCSLHFILHKFGNIHRKSLPVMTQRMTNDQGPYVLRLGGSGLVSSLDRPAWPSSRTSTWSRFKKFMAAAETRTGE